MTRAIDSCHSGVHHSGHHFERGLAIRTGRMNRGLATLCDAKSSHGAACTYESHTRDMTWLIPCIVLLIAPVEDLDLKRGEGL